MSLNQRLHKSGKVFFGSGGQATAKNSSGADVKPG